MGAFSIMFGGLGRAMGYNQSYDARGWGLPPLSGGGAPRPQFAESASSIQTVGKVKQDASLSVYRKAAVARAGSS